MIINPIILTFFFYAIIIAISLGLHEYAHALTSYNLGDPTPKLQNRLTPNPLAHLDLIGFVAIFVIHFGWAKPVQIDYRYYKNPAQDIVKVALAGPLTNLLLALLGMIICLFVNKYSEGSYVLVISFWQLFAEINIGLAVFNLIPIPPLDGSRLLIYFLPQIAHHMFWLENFASINLFFLVILFTRFFGYYINFIESQIFYLFYLIGRFIIY